MSTQRRARILSLLALEGVAPSGTKRLCDMAVSATGLTGAGIMLISDDGPRGSLCASDEVSVRIDELQYTLGQGPGIDAHFEGRSISEPDLHAPGQCRWPMFSNQVVEDGVRAVFAFPIRLGAVRIGALSLYRERPGPLADDQHADALVVAAVLAESVLALLADAPIGRIAEMLAADGDFHYVVHQASGMVSAQLDIDVAEALVRLRAYAFSSGRTVVDVSQAVVQQNLRIDHPDDPDRPN